MPVPLRLPLTVEQRRAMRAVQRAHDRLLAAREERDAAIAAAVNERGIAAIRLADELAIPGMGPRW